TNDFPHALLMSGIGVGMEKTDGEDADTLLAQPADDGSCSGLIEGHKNFAPVVDPFGHLPAQMPPHQGDRFAIQNVVHVRSIKPADLEYVAKAFGGDEACPGAFAFEKGIQSQRGSMNEQPDAFQLNVPLLERGHDSHRRIVRGRLSLLKTHPPAVLIEEHQIRECSSDIDGNATPLLRLHAHESWLALASESNSVADQEDRAG